MDCTVLLGAQLARLESIADALSCASAAARPQLLRELLDRGALHVRVREQLLFPVLRRARWKGVNSETLKVHVRLKRALAELMVTPAQSDRFNDLLHKFAQGVALQLAEDARAFVPALRAASDIDERRALCREIELLHDKETTPSGPPAPGLVEEAALVLRSLPGLAS